KYLGSAGSTFRSTDGLPEDATPLQQELYRTSQWNTFFSMVNYRTGTNGMTYKNQEQETAGVYIDAPEGYGYLGSYVWLDYNWDTLQNDTLGETTTDALGNETTYHKASNGRYLLSTERSIDEETGKLVYTYGDGQDTRALYKDVNHDDVAEDPGINGVLVELLNENGVPVNRNGEAVVQVRESKTSDKMVWVKANPKTGEALTNVYGGYDLASTNENIELGAYTFTTESDYYNNAGYYMFSMLKPGKYRLRFTFPQQYSNYALTTKRIGATNAPVTNDLGEVQGGTEDISAYMMVERADGTMTATSDVIEVKAMEYNPAAYESGAPLSGNESYDARMTSYNVGIAMPVTYTGVAFRDDKLAGYEDLEEDVEIGEEPDEGEDEGAGDNTGGIFSLTTQALDTLSTMEAAGAVSTDTTVLPGISTLALTPDNAPEIDRDKGEAEYFITVNGKKTLNLDKMVELDGTLDPELIDGVLDWVNIDLDANNPITSDTDAVTALPVEELRLKNMEVSVQVYNEATGAWEQAYDADGNKALIQTDNVLYVRADASENWQRAFDEEGNKLVDVEDYDTLEWKWEPTTGTDATGAFSFTLEPEHYYKIVCKDMKNRVLKPSVMNWSSDPLELPTKNAEDQAKDKDGNPVDQVAAMWDNDLWLKSGLGETNSFYAAVPTVGNGSNKAVYEDPSKPWLGYKHYDKLALGWIDGTKGYLGNYIWDDSADTTHRYNGVQDEVPAIGVGGVTVTLEQYYWRPNNPDAYNADGVNAAGDGQWVLNDLEYKTARTSNAGSYIFKGVSTYVADPEAGKTVREEDKAKYIAGYRIRIDRDNLKSVTKDWGITFRNNYIASALAPDSNAEETDSDAMMSAELVKNADGSNYMKDGKVVYAYYLNRLDDMKLDSDLAYQNLIVMAGDADETSTLDNLRPMSYGTLAHSSRDVYDLGSAQRIEHWDVGLIEVPRSTISGTLWHDADYDGVMDAEEERLAGEKVSLTQWYWKDGTWVQNKNFGNDVRTSTKGTWAIGKNAKVAGGYLTVETDAKGVYTFNNLPTAYTNDEGEHYLAAYRVSLDALRTTKVYDEDDPDTLLYETPWMMTHFHQGEALLADSDVEDTLLQTDTHFRVVGREEDSTGLGATVNQRALKNDGQIILADIVRTGRENAGQPSQITVPMDEVYEGATGEVKYDYLVKRADKVQGGDVGEIPVPRREISGRVWHDADYDGLQATAEAEEPVLDDEGNPVLDDEGNPVTQKVTGYDPAEPGIEDQTVVLSQYFYDATRTNEDEDDPSFGTHWLRNTAFGSDGANVLATIATGEWAEGAVLTDDGRVAVQTKTDGVYRFENLPSAYVGEDGKLYLASYRVTLEGLYVDEVTDEATGAVVSKIPWMMTRYHATQAVGSDSDVADNQLGTEASYNLIGREPSAEDELPGVRALSGHIVLAAPVDAQVPVAGQTAQVPLAAADIFENAAGEAVYDMMLAKQEGAYDGGDAGELPVPTRSVEGLVWRDADYDGLQDTTSKETVTDKDGKPLTKLVEEGLEDQTITLEQWYFDPDAVNDEAPAFLTDDFDYATLNLSGKIDAGYESHWFRNDEFGADVYTQLNDEEHPLVQGDWAADATVDDGVITVKTNKKGLYRFDNLPTAYTDHDGKQYLAGYRVKLERLAEDYNSDHYDMPQEGSWMMTRFHAGTTEEALPVDSDLPDNLGLTMNYPLIGREAFVADEGEAGEDGTATATPLRYLGERQEMLEGQIILAAPGADRGATANATTAASDFQNDRDGTMTFDWLEARAYDEGADAVEGGDAGQLPPPTQDIVGIFWNDADNDGVQTIDEHGNPVVMDAEGNRVIIDYNADGTIQVYEALLQSDPATEGDEEAATVTVTKGKRVQYSEANADGTVTLYRLSADGATFEEQKTYQPEELNDAYRNGDVYQESASENGINNARVTLERYIPDENGNWVEDPEWVSASYDLDGKGWDDYHKNPSTVWGDDPQHVQYTAVQEASDGQMRAGVYRFENLPTQRADENGKKIVYGYRVRYTDSGYQQRAWMIAKYQQKDNFTQDSDLINVNANLMAADEVDVLLNRKDEGSVLGNITEGNASNNDNQDKGLLSLEEALAQKKDATRTVPAASTLSTGFASVLASTVANTAQALGANPLAAGAELYDLGAGSDRAYNDAALLKRKTGTIEGVLFQDENYDGALQRDEARLAGKRVYLRAWGLRLVADGSDDCHCDEADKTAAEGQLPASAGAITSPREGYHYEWVAEEDGETSVLTDSHGRYAFENLPAATRHVKTTDEENASKDNWQDDKGGDDDVLVTDNFDEWYLLGYTLEVEGASQASLGDDASETVVGLPVTRLLGDGTEEEPVSRTASKVHRAADSDALNARLANDATYGADRFAISLNQVNNQGETESVLDGRLVLADRATTAEDAVGATDPTYYVNANGMEFDLSTIRSVDCMNGGFGPFGRATIAGVVWNDANYDGIRDYVTSIDVPEEGDEDGAEPDVPTSVVNLEEPLAGQTVYLTQEYLDPTTNKWVFNPDFGGLDPKVGDLSATDQSVAVRTVTANTEYSISGFVDAEGNLVEMGTIWFTEPDDPNVNGVDVFPWPEEPGVFTDGMTVTTTDEDGNEVIYTLVITPNTEYGVACRVRGDDDPANPGVPVYVTCENPRYVATRGESKLQGAAFAEGAITATATSMIFTEKPLWWRDLADPDLAEADSVEGWNGWEYAAVPVDATDDEINALDSDQWFRANKTTGLVVIGNLSQRTAYKVVARIRAFDEFDIPEVAAWAAEDAVAELETLGLVVEMVQEHTDAVPNGAVIRTEPAAGATGKPGMTVKLVVSSGPRQPVLVPEVTG
ncbi:MAG: PASTA domain-containing protein, partial [Adlercreutzia sp.]|nr:PASTA domain-containing protein [Adlercreutzia sp.]